MIPVCTPLLGKLEKKYLVECVDTNWISSAGKYIELFEEQFSRYCNAKYGVTVTSGTAALHLAFVAAGIGPGDEVIMPTFNIASPAFAAVYCGAKPVFVDSEPDTWNMDPTLIEQKITRRTKAIVPVHMYGHPCDMTAIMRIARRHKLIVIEDAAEAHGAEYKGKKAGGIGDMGCFSFYGNKIITCGEGGMVVTNRKKWADKIKQLRNLSFLPEKRFWHKEIGFNYRMTNMQAALGLAQFERIEQMTQKRRANAAIYSSRLSKIKGLTLPVERSYAKNVYWMYSFLVNKNFGVNRDALMCRLKEKGVETRTFFIPMHQQPVFKKMGILDNGPYPVADDIAARGMYVPSGSGLKKSEIMYICDCIKNAQRVS